MLAIEASGLGRAWPGGVEGSLAVVRRLGSVQIDTISVVERAHGHILWSRNPDYAEEHLRRLEASPRRIIEYWSHAAAYLPFDDYRFCIPRMERVRAEGHEWYRTDKAVARRVLARVRTEGPLRAQDFEGPKKGAGGWWDWKPEKRALEYLFHAGELVSLGRRSFQKVYELAERALPSGTDLRRPTAEEHAAFYVDLAAASLGVFAREDVAYMRKDGISGIEGELASRVEDGRLVELDIGDLRERRGGTERPTHYASPATLGRVRVSGDLVVRVLSPFDPLIIDRKRTIRIFDRSVQLECYLPTAKRSFGYFALPLLVTGADGTARLAGLLDAKAERRQGRLVARRLSIDTAPRDSSGRAPSPSAMADAMACALWAFAAFNGAERVELERFEAYDGRIERSLRSALSRRIRTIPRAAGAPATSGALPASGRGTAEARGPRRRPT